MVDRLVGFRAKMSSSPDEAAESPEGSHLLRIAEPLMNKNRAGVLHPATRRDRLFLFPVASVGDVCLISKNRLVLLPPSFIVAQNSFTDEPRLQIPFLLSLSSLLFIEQLQTV